RAIQFSISCCPAASRSFSERVRQALKLPCDKVSNMKRSALWSGHRYPLVGDRKQCDQLDEAMTATRHGEPAKVSAMAAPTSMQRHGYGDGGSGISVSGRGGMNKAEVPPFACNRLLP